MNNCIKIMSDEICDVLRKREPSVYLKGSIVLGDYKKGHSDIDILCVTKERIEKNEAEELLCLRQRLSSRNRKYDYMRVFEGAFIPLDALIDGESERVVYWGKKGARITDRYVMSALSTIELLDSGVLISGKEIRDRIKRPSLEEIKNDAGLYVKGVLRNIRWERSEEKLSERMLEMARCLCTLETGRVLSKTKAAETVALIGEYPFEDTLRRISDRRREASDKKSPCGVGVFTLEENVRAFAKVILDKIGEEAV